MQVALVAPSALGVSRVFDDRPLAAEVSPPVIPSAPEDRRGRAFEPPVNPETPPDAPDHGGERDSSSPLDLSEEERRDVARLRARDAEVRRHEQSHAIAAGPYGGAPIYSFERGPNGRFYAVGGHVRIDTSPEPTPEATIRKMEAVIRAAQAPASPSAGDRAVAHQAHQHKSGAQAELNAEKRAERLRDGRDEGGFADAAADFVESVRAARVYEASAALLDPASAVPSPDTSIQNVLV